MARVPSAWPVYRIVRFRRDKPSRTIRSGVTLADAQAHCSREDTRGTNWFDGYTFIKGFKPPEEAETVT